MGIKGRSIKVTFLVLTYNEIFRTLLNDRLTIYPKNQNSCIYGVRLCLTIDTCWLMFNDFFCSHYSTFDLRRLPLSFLQLGGIFNTAHLT